MLGSSRTRRAKNLLETSRIEKNLSLNEVSKILEVPEDDLIKYEEDIGKTPVYTALRLFKLYGLPVKLL